VVLWLDYFLAKILGSSVHQVDPTTKPVSFDTAKTRRQQARTAGLHPDFWYAVEFDKALPIRGIIETRFWGRSIALFRGEDGQVRSVENSCLHRQVKLSLGEVHDCALVCPYHGWAYDGAGKVVAVPHELFGRNLPQARLKSFPVRIRYGLIWLFPGDPNLADTTAMPEIPELEGQDRWACVPLDFTWRAHHSMILENVSDFTHAHLHRSYRPFSDAKLKFCEPKEGRIHLGYDVLVGDGPISKHFVDRKKVNVNKMELCFDYPHQWSNTGDRIKHWCFVLPLDERTTRVFFLFYFESLRIPATHVSIPRWLMVPLLAIANKIMIRPLLTQDGGMVEAEQAAFDKYPSSNAIELNPAVHEFQRLMIAQWQRYLNKNGQYSSEREKILAE
jgi:phenylpropionate dioxygenase-like ring-hydroxylating dioxygenase large terminal subunit